MAGRDEMFPKIFSKIHPKYRTPIPGLTLLLIIALIFLFTFIPLLSPEYGIATAAVLLSAVTGVVVLILQVPLCLSAMKIPKKFPQLHERSGFKPAFKTLKIMSILGVISSIVFVLLLITDPDAGLIIALIVFPYAFIGIVIYLIRKKMLKRKGIDIGEVVKSWPKQVTFEDKGPSKIERMAAEKEG
jgi:amino acid transporter